MRILYLETGNQIGQSSLLMCWALVFFLNRRFITRGAEAGRGRYRVSTLGLSFLPQYVVAHVRDRNATDITYFGKSPLRHFKQYTVR